MAKLQSVPEFQRRLAAALPRVRATVQGTPEPALAAILAQLERLAVSSQGGAPPTPEEKDALTFGMLASRHLDDLDQPLAQELYELASWVTYWR